MGMEGIISDMRAGKQRLQAKYLEAHASAMHHFSDVAAVRTAVEAACSPPQEQAPAKTDDSQGAIRWVLWLSPLFCHLPAVRMVQLQQCHQYCVHLQRSQAMCCMLMRS